jgi:hypothetical protein
VSLQLQPATIVHLATRGASIFCIADHSVKVSVPSDQTAVEVKETIGRYIAALTGTPMHMVGEDRITLN